MDDEHVMPFGIRSSKESGCSGELHRIASERTVVTRPILRQRGEADGDRFASKIDERKREKGTHRAVEFIGGCIKFRGKQRGRTLGVAKVAQRTGHLNGCPASAKPGQSGCERGTIERNCNVGVAGGILSRSALEESDRIPGAQRCDQEFELCDESIGSAVVNRLPQVGKAPFPCFIVDVHPKSLDHMNAGCVTSQPATAAVAKSCRQSSVLIDNVHWPRTVS